MGSTPFLLTFDESWFKNPDSVDGILERLDMGETISIKALKEACEKEGREFKIKIE